MKHLILAPQPIPDTPPSNLAGLDMVFIYSIAAAVIVLLLFIVGAKMIMNGIGDNRIAKTGTKFGHVLIGLFTIALGTIGIMGIIYALAEGIKA